MDEADLCTDLDRLMRTVKPTIDGGGRMVLLSRSDKSKPHSPFKRMYQAARQGLNRWVPIFLPWHARPDRDAAWYEAQRRDVLARTGATDDLAEQYPATDIEALAQRQLDNRIPTAWLMQCYQEASATDPGVLYAPAQRLPAIPALVVYARPQPGRAYVIGADPAEGNPTSDDSALAVLDTMTGEEVATLAGRFEPTVFAGYVAQLAQWYGAAILCERNNHGHAVIARLDDFGLSSSLLHGHDNKTGWMSSTLGKVRMYDAAADACRNRETVIHSFATFTQLASIEGSTLRAPEGQYDDRADAFALACAARLQMPAADDDYFEPVLGSSGFQPHNYPSEPFMGGW